MIAVAVLLAAGTTAAVVFTGEDNAPTTFTISGTGRVKYAGNPFEYDGTLCEVPDGYGDIPGAQVVVTAPTGRVIATGNLSAVGVNRPGSIDGIPAASCEFAIDSAAVPEGHDFYGVEVSHRGRVQYTRDQLRTPIMLTLGN
ncbi:hypothetical protein [Thermomonospora amylolytica]|uniref:hypothetical protein n=1 Tax=Thermomonospora amylolytica TaxID=1411117 RepID=UPI0013002D05|nr:hypothetical protein [Thermomonospora amylolytica]